MRDTLLEIEVLHELLLSVRAINLANENAGIPIDSELRLEEVLAETLTKLVASLFVETSTIPNVAQPFTPPSVWPGYPTLPSTPNVAGCAAVPVY